ncbi:MAG: ABC transporter permease [Limisphaerales bacterium]
MKLLPIAERELRVASRKRGTYWTRFVAAALGMGAVGLILLSTTHLRPSDQSQMLFVTLTVLAFVYCLLSGVVTTADCVSEERREGTLGLLFLTNLRGYDVVVGKLAASSARSILAVVALLPLIAIPVLMGGVEGRVVGMVALILGNTLFLSLVIGVLASVLSRDARQAIGGTIAMLAAWVGLLPLLRILWIEYLVRPRFTGGAGELSSRMNWILELNPVVLFARTLESMFRGAPPWRDLGDALLLQHGLGWLILVASCLILPRAWRDRVDVRAAAAATSVSASGARAASVESARSKEKRVWRTELLNWHPFAWIVARDWRPWVYTWVGFGVVGVVWCWGFLEVKEDWLEGVVGLWTVFFAALWLKLRLAEMACRHLHEHRRSGALELVLSTPMTPEAMVRGQLLGMRHRMLAPLAVLGVAAGLLMVAGLGQAHSWGDRTEIPATFAVGLAVLVLDLVTLAWGGMWIGLRSGRFIRAYAETVGIVLFLPWVLFVLSLILGATLEDLTGFRGVGRSGYLSVLAWWALISVAVDLWVLRFARRGLYGRFRELAAEPYGTLRQAGMKPTAPAVPPATEGSAASVATGKP